MRVHLALECAVKAKVQNLIIPRLSRSRVGAPLTLHSGGDWRYPSILPRDQGLREIPDPHRFLFPGVVYRWPGQERQPRDFTKPWLQNDAQKARIRRYKVAPRLRAPRIRAPHVTTSSVAVTSNYGKPDDAILRILQGGGGDLYSLMLSGAIPRPPRIPVPEGSDWGNLSRADWQRLGLTAPRGRAAGEYEKLGLPPPPGRALKTAHGDRMTGVKQQSPPLDPATGKRYPTIPAYPSSPRFPVGGVDEQSYLGSPFPISTYNQGRVRTMQTLASTLGRKPTKEEKQAAMRNFRAVAAAAGVHPTNPDNFPTSTPEPYPFLGQAAYRNQPRWPFTQNDQEMADYLRPIDFPPGLTLEQRIRNHVTYNRHTGGSQYAPATATTPAHYMQTSHPIDPNAYIRPYYPEASGVPYGSGYFGLTGSSGRFLEELPDPNFDPRKPESYNRHLPTALANEGLSYNPPNAPLTQDQMDALRRDYYTQHPALVPQPGQPGYNAWRKQNLRGK